MKRVLHVLSVCAIVGCASGASIASAAPGHYTLDPSQSFVHFDAKTTTHDFGGDTRTLSGEMDWDASDPASVPAAVVRIPVAPIKTGVAPRDRSLRRMFEDKKYPDIEFRVDPSAQASEDRLAGVLKIRDVEYPLTVPVVRRAGPAGAWEVEGDAEVSLETFRLKPPALLGVVRVLPLIKIHFKSVWKPAA